MTQIKAEYVDHMGSDLRVVNAARISLGSGSAELSEKDEKLISYLAKNKHMSPFEHCIMTCIVHCPLYIRSQIMRHRTFSYNEISRRYTSDDIEFYVPSEFKKQAKTNRQTSDEPLWGEFQDYARWDYKNAIERALEEYEGMLSLGISREQARAILPQALMTKFYMTGNLRNWAHFIELRDSSHSQEEAQIVARQVRGHLMDHFPVSTRALLVDKQ